MPSPFGRDGEAPKPKLSRPVRTVGVFQDDAGAGGGSGPPDVDEWGGIVDDEAEVGGIGR